MWIELLFALALLVAFKLIVNIANHFQHASRARRLGCKLPISRSSLVFGIDHILRMSKADWDMRLPHFLVECFESRKTPDGRPVQTLSQRQLGETSFVTCDPKNIQAILASQFRDFEFGEKRRNGLRPLLGTGIVR